MGAMAKDEWYSDGLRFTCNQCGNCCTGAPGYVFYNEAEGEAIAEELGMTVEAFEDAYTVLLGEHRSIRDAWNPESKGNDCLFLDWVDGKAQCSIYNVRPTQCRTWPFWPSNLESPRSWQRAGVKCAGMKSGNAGQGKFFPVEQIRVIRDRQAAED